MMYGRQGRRGVGRGMGRRMAHDEFGSAAEMLFGRGRGGPYRGSFEGGGGRGRRKRIFDQAELQMLLLDLIAEAPRHGYDLIREIETLSGGEYAPSPGIVYPALTYMEEAGLIAVADDGSTRRSYAATNEGRQRAKDGADKVRALKGRLIALAEARDKVDPAPVRRAMQALKTAMFDRLSQDGASRETALQIADAIDEATRKIERIEP